MFCGSAKIRETNEQINLLIFFFFYTDFLLFSLSVDSIPKIAACAPEEEVCPGHPGQRLIQQNQP